MNGLKRWVIEKGEVFRSHRISDRAGYVSGAGNGSERMFPISGAVRDEYPERSAWATKPIAPDIHPARAMDRNVCSRSRGTVRDEYPERSGRTNRLPGAQSLYGLRATP
ncbi:MAG: hypothetical protein ACOY90_09420 [Candidatus Zhuqueibacterota bacterium]